MKTHFLFRKVALFVGLLIPWTTVAAQAGNLLPFQYDDSVFCTAVERIAPKNPCSCAYRTNQTAIPVNSVTGEIDFNNIPIDSLDTQVDLLVFRDHGSPVQTDTVALTVLKAPEARVLYPFTAYCETYDRPILPQSPSSETPGLNRQFWATPSGLNIHAGTGSVDIRHSTAGRYDVHFQETTQLVYDSSGSTSTFECQVGDVTHFDLVAVDNNTSLEFPVDSVCKGSTTPLVPEVTHDRTGIWEYPAGTEILPGSPPQILPATMDSGQYIIEYYFNNVCLQSVNDTIWILTDIFLDEVYPREYYCEEDSSASPDGNLPAGYFSSMTLSPLALDPDSGSIDFSHVVFNSDHEVSFTTFETCPRTSISVLYFKTARPNTTLLDPDGYCVGDSIEIEIIPKEYTESIILYFGSQSEEWYLDPYALIQDTLLFSGKVEGTDSSYDINSETDWCYDRTEFPIFLHPNQGLSSIYKQDTLIVTPHAHQEVHFLPEDTTIPGNYRWELKFPESLKEYNLAENNKEGAGEYQPGAAPDQTRFDYSFPELSGTVFADLVIQFSQNNCPFKTDTLQLKFLPELKSGFFVPEVITPNNDGQNDTWVIEHDPGRIRNPDGYHLNLFNLQYALVAQLSIGGAKFWQGGGLPAGVYWWQIIGPQQEIVDTGGLTIVRPHQDPTN